MTKSEKLCLMRELYEAGSSIEAIAEATGYKVNSVRQLLPQAGVIRQRSIKDIGKQVVQMRNEGMKLEQISRLTGYSAPALSQYLCKIGCNKNRTWTEQEDNEPIDESRIVFAEPMHVMIERFIYQWNPFCEIIHYVTVPLEELYQS